MTIVNYMISPRSRQYWVEAIALDGSRQPIEAPSTATNISARRTSPVAGSAIGIRLPE